MLLETEYIITEKWNQIANTLLNKQRKLTILWIVLLVMIWKANFVLCHFSRWSRSQKWQILNFSLNRLALNGYLACKISCDNTVSSYLLIYIHKAKYITLLLIHLYCSDDVENAFIQLGIECYVRSIASSSIACRVIKSTATKPFLQSAFFLRGKWLDS